MGPLWNLWIIPYFRSCSTNMLLEAGTSMGHGYFPDVTQSLPEPTRPTDKGPLQNHEVNPTYHPHEPPYIDMLAARCQHPSITAVSFITSLLRPSEPLTYGITWIQQVYEHIAKSSSSRSHCVPRDNFYSRVSVSSSAAQLQRLKYRLDAPKVFSGTAQKTLAGRCGSRGTSVKQMKAKREHPCWKHDHLYANIHTVYTDTVTYIQKYNLRCVCSHTKLRKGTKMQNFISLSLKIINTVNGTFYMSRKNIPSWAGDDLSVVTWARMEVHF